MQRISRWCRQIYSNGWLNFRKWRGISLNSTLWGEKKSNAKTKFVCPKRFKIYNPCSEEYKRKRESKRQGKVGSGEGEISCSKRYKLICPGRKKNNKECQKEELPKEELKKSEVAKEERQKEELKKSEVAKEERQKEELKEREVPKEERKKEDLKKRQCRPQVEWSKTDDQKEESPKMEFQKEECPKKQKPDSPKQPQERDLEVFPFKIEDQGEGKCCKLTRTCDKAPRHAPEFVPQLMECKNSNNSEKPHASQSTEHEPPTKKDFFRSAWEFPKCCPMPCPNVMPRFDDLYYRPSDKSKRVYEQTWVEFEQPPMKKKYVCATTETPERPFQRRKKGDRPQTAQGPKDSGLTCETRGDSKCMKITLSGCEKAREPPKCHRERRPTACRKINCPYPAFSECQKAKAEKKHPTECACLDPVSNCEVQEEVSKNKEKHEPECNN